MGYKDHMTSKRRFRIRGRFWIEGPNGTFLGYGRIRLLEGIRDLGSISAAARAMKMSYRRAWQLVDAINQQSRAPIVEKSIGGKGGGGAVLTESGLRAIDLFWSTHRDFEDYIGEKNRALDF